MYGIGERGGVDFDGLAWKNQYAKKNILQFLLFIRIPY
jgi:hypothetical protein